MRLITWCDRSIKMGFYLLFGLVPLLLTPWNYELFEYNKMMAVYGITVIISIAWIIKMIKQGEIRIAKTPLDIPIALFFLSQLVSALSSIDPHVSWFGYYSRFNGGMFSVISYVTLYYAFLSHLDIFTTEVKGQKKSVSLLPLFKVTLVTTTLVAIYGVAERLGIDKHLWVQDVQNRVFSTLGQPNWLAAYITALIPLTMALGFNRGNQTRTVSFPMILASLLSLLFFVVLLFTKSRSGLLAFAIADALFWFLQGMALKRASKQPLQGHPLLKPVVILHLVFALFIFINGTGIEGLDKYVTIKGIQSNISRVTQKPSVATASATIAGPALEVGGTESGTIRKYVWLGAINAWKSSTKTKLIGTGTETFAFAFYQFRPVGHNQTSEWDFLYNKAHNEYLNYLATTGAFGLGSYLLFIGAFIWWFVRIAQNETKEELTPIHYALFSGWISVLITNFFGFSVVIVQLFLFLLPAFIVALTSPHETILMRRKEIHASHWIMWLVFIIGLYILMRIGAFWYADVLYARGYRLSRSGLYGQSIIALTDAISLNRTEPTYHDELSSNYATLAVAAFEGKNATQAAQLATLAVSESVKAVNTSPRNVNFYKTRTKVYYTLSSLEATFNAKAIEALNQALTLSPNDPKIYYNLAILIGREGESDKAIAHLLKAKALKSNYRDAYFALWVFYTEAKKPKEAKAILQEYITTIDPNDKDFLERLQ